MTRQQRPPEILKSVAGAALVGLGLHILFGNLDRVAAQLRQINGTGTEQALGILPSVVLEASQAARAYSSDHHGFLLGLLRMLISFWPALLVIVGTILLRNVFTEKALPVRDPQFQEITFKNKNSRCRFHRPSFDA
jgi:hypothetical protein